MNILTILVIVLAVLSIRSHILQKRTIKKIEMLDREIDFFTLFINRKFNKRNN